MTEEPSTTCGRRSCRRTKRSCASSKQVPRSLYARSTRVRVCLSNVSRLRYQTRAVAVLRGHRLAPAMQRRQRDQQQKQLKGRSHDKGKNTADDDGSAGKRLIVALAAGAVGVGVFAAPASAQPTGGPGEPTCRAGFTSTSVQPWAFRPRQARGCAMFFGDYPTAVQDAEWAVQEFCASRRSSEVRSDGGASARHHEPWPRRLALVVKRGLGGDDVAQYWEEGSRRVHGTG